MTDQITYIPASALRESPFNPRKSFAADALTDLAESIRSQGILQPIVVRPLPDGQVDIEHRYEIVFGHRRFRAASMLPDYRDGTLSLPCILREMDDRDASVAQVAENLQRADVTAIEEADSFRHLHWQHHMSADAIAERVGKSRSYVYARLKLAAAGADVRTAVLEQGLLPEVALEVARLRGDKLQRMGLQAIKAGDDWLSQRRAKVVIRDMLTEHQLDAAPFDQEDATLVHCAPACSGCPKRAGNDPDLVAMGIAADVCTDAVCFGDKLRAHSTRVVAQLKADGQEVIEAAEAAKLFQGMGGRYSSPRGYTRTDYSHAIGGYDGDGDYVHRSVDQALQALADAGEQVPAVQRVAIVNPESGVHATYITDVDAEVLRKALRDLAHRRRTEAAQASAPASTPSTAAHAQEGAREPDMSGWSDAERAATDDQVVHRARDAALRNMLAQARTTDDLRVMLMREAEYGADLEDEPVMHLMGLTEEFYAAQAAGGDDWDDQAWWRQRLATATADQLGQMVVGLAIGALFDSVELWRSCDMAKKRAEAADQVALAQRYGVDLAAIAAQLEEQTDDAAGHAAGGSDATAEPANGDLFGGEADDQSDDAGPAGGPRAPTELVPEKAWPFPKKAA